MQRARTYLAAVGMVAMVVSGPAHAQETLKIGALVTLHGPGASWGRGMKRAAELAAEDVNKAGGLEVGEKHYTVEIVSYDDGYKPDVAVIAANRLVHEDKVKYIVGTVGSGPMLAIQPITEKNHVITLTLGFTSRALSPDKPYTFRPNLTTAEIFQPQIDWIVANRNVKTVGGLFPNDQTGDQIARDVGAAYAKAGAKLTATEFFDRDRVDFAPLLNRIKAAGVDAIELDGNAPTAVGQIVKQARAIGFEGAIVRTGAPATQNIIDVAGKDAAEGLFVHSSVDESIPSVKAYSERVPENLRRSDERLQSLFLRRGQNAVPGDADGRDGRGYRQGA